MKLRRVQNRSQDDRFSVEAKIGEYWIPLKCIGELNDIAERYGVKENLATDLLAVLKLGKPGWDELSEYLSAVIPSAEKDTDTVVLPFQPASFREFTLYEEHYVNMAREHVRRYMPALAPICSVYEKITGKVFPALKPNKLWYQQPLYYFGSHLNFYADGERVAKPDYVQDLDFELELAAIISKEVCDLDEKSAVDAIGGFVLINDFSSRGHNQRIEMASGCGPQKSKHFANSMGSVVVTADEILGREQNLVGSIEINGRSIASCHSSGMKFSFPEIIAFLSQGQTLFPGEILASGTLPGGSGMECGQLLSSGDHLKLELEGIGWLENHID